MSDVLTESSKNSICLAKNFEKFMKRKGENVLFFHSGEGLKIFIKSGSHHI